MTPIVLAWLCAASPAQADPWDEVAAAAEMSTAEVKAALDGVTKQQSVLDRMARPYESKPWHEYVKLFVTDERVAGGVRFWNAHADQLARTAETTGVPAEIVVAIIGVETRYGERMGDDRVADALYTLGFFHPRRGRYFRGELGHFVRLCRQEGWPVLEPLGSYAGAMGMGQFMPSSYHAYAADGDGDGKRDLFGNVGDAIASVGNYLARHGWQRGGRVLLAASGDAAVLARLAEGKGMEPTTPWSDLAAAGVRVQAPPSDDTKSRVYRFQEPDGLRYGVGLPNFYAITRYNHSTLYARAVADLADAIATQRAAQAP